MLAMSWTVCLTAVASAVGDAAAEETASDGADTEAGTLASAEERSGETAAEMGNLSYGPRLTTVSAYGIDNKLYTFVQAEGEHDPAQMKASLKLENNTLLDAMTDPKKLTDCDTIVRYLLMVDLSGSMRKYSSVIEPFIYSLMEQEKQDVVFTVAGFGEKFEQVHENLTDPAAVADAVRNLEYNQMLTDPYNGLVYALNYIGSTSRLGGDLVNLVIITDGVPDLGKQGEEEQTAEKAAAETTLMALGESAETVVHTVCVSEWDDLAQQTLSQGSGLDLMITDAEDAESAGKEMAEFIDGLYRIDFPCPAHSAMERFPVEMRFVGRINNNIAVSETRISGVTVLRSGVAAPVVPSKQEQTEGAENGETPSEPASSAAEGDLPEITVPATENPMETESVSGTEDSSETETAPETDADGTISEGESSDAASLPDNEADDPENGGGKRKLFLILGIAAGVLLAAVAAVLVFLKGKNRKAGENGGSHDGSGIFMKMEVISGRYAGSRTTFLLKDQLLIGSGKNCDMIWNDAGVAPQNTRVFLKDQVVYVEDLNSPEGTFLCGMRIYSPNRLRSGNDISIGGVSFRLRF